MSKLTLRMRITMLVGIIVVANAVLLTAASISGANNYFVGTPMNKTVVEPQEIGQQLGKELNGKVDDLTVRVQVMEAQKKFSSQILIIMVVIIVVGIGVTYMIVGRALKPLSDLSETIKDINERNLSKWVHVPHSKDEVGSLSVSFNSMLDRLDGSFARQKRFAANAAHELKTPLATIKTSLQVLHLDDNPTSEDYRANAEATEQSTERLIRVVDDLLKFAVEDHTNFHDEITVKTMYEDIAKELWSLADDNHVSIVIHATDCQLIGNKTLLYRAIFNLVANAVKYNKQGGRVELFARKGKDTVVMTVRDCGIGMSQDEVSNVFEPFYRVDKSRSREIAGSGLGLSLVKTIIDKHNGTIDMRSIEGIGTTIDVTLPVSYDEA